MVGPSYVFQVRQLSPLSWVGRFSTNLQEFFVASRLDLGGERCCCSMFIGAFSHSPEIDILTTRVSCFSPYQHRFIEVKPSHDYVYTFPGKKRFAVCHFIKIWTQGIENMWSPIPFWFEIHTGRKMG